jgi:hypothetical protein
MMEGEKMIATTAFGAAPVCGSLAESHGFFESAVKGGYDIRQRAGVTNDHSEFFSMNKDPRRAPWAFAHGT